MIRKKSIKTREILYKDSVKRIGIRVNQSVDTCTMVSAACRRFVLEQLVEKVEEYGEDITMTSVDIELFIDIVTDACKLWIAMQQSFHTEQFKKMQIEELDIKEEDIWVDDELDLQLKFENHDCNQTMVVIDIPKHTVELI